MSRILKEDRMKEVVVVIDDFRREFKGIEST